MNLTDHKHVLQMLKGMGLILTPLGNGDIKVDHAELLTPELRKIIKTH